MAHTFLGARARNSQAPLLLLYLGIGDRHTTFISAAMNDESISFYNTRQNEINDALTKTSSEKYDSACLPFSVFWFVFIVR